MEMPKYDFCDEKDFELKLRERTNYVLEKYGDIPFIPVGNPIVDSGIILISILNNIESPFNLKLSHAVNSYIKLRYQDNYGLELALMNSKAKSVFMLFLNNPLLNPIYGKNKTENDCILKPSAAEPSPLQQRLFRVYLIEFLLNYGTDYQNNGSSDTKCITCGISTHFDYNKLDSKIYKLVNPDKTREFGAGPTRGWFPLIGSIGSEAQSLPAFSETFPICGRCLFTPQYLPIMVNMYEGKQALYQSNNMKLSREFIKLNFETFCEIYESTPMDKKIENVGKKEGHTYLVLNLLEILSRYSKEIRSCILTIWLINNSGTSPDSLTISIPEDRLLFLNMLYSKLNAKEQIESFIKAERKKLGHSDRFFLNTLLSGRDYDGFYNKSTVETSNLPSAELYEFYQVSIRRWHPDAIELVKLISSLIKDELTPNRLDRLFKSWNRRDLRSEIQPRIIQALLDEKCTIEQISYLFHTDYPEIPNRSIWKLFKFYLHPNLIFNLKVTFDPIHDLNYNQDDIEDLSLIYATSNKTKEKAKTRSSFDEQKYNERMNEYSWNNLMRDYISMGENEIGYTWERLDQIKRKHNISDLIFNFRLFSTLNENIELFENKIHHTIDRDRLILENGLNEDLTNYLIKYVEIRIEEIGKQRFYNEFPEDLRRGNYSADRLLHTINNKLSEYSKDDQITEYMWFGHEVEKSIKGEFSWYSLKSKIRLFVYQNRLLKEKTVPSLTEQIKEVKL